MKLQRYRCVLRKSGVLTVNERVMNRPEQVIEVAHAMTKDLPHEVVLCFHVNGRNELVGVEQISQGGLHGCALTPRDVLRGAIAGNASAIILVHNHPSGDPDPSPEDIAMTRAVRDACNVVAVPLLDHLIVSPNKRWSSLADRGII